MGLIKTQDAEKYVTSHLIGKTVAHAELLLNPVKWTICVVERDGHATGHPITRDVNPKRLRVSVKDSLIERFVGVG